MTRKTIKYRLSAIVLFLAVLVLGPGASGFCADSRIKLGLIMEKSEYSSDEPVNVVLYLKNQGNEPVMVNKRFYIGSEKSPLNQKDVCFELLSPQGVKLEGEHFYPTGYPKSDYFMVLAPNEEIKSEYPRNLRGFFEITAPGTYTLKAVYQNAFGAELGLDVFKETLVSDPVKFTIVDNKK